MFKTKPYNIPRNFNIMFSLVAQTVLPSMMRSTSFYAFRKGNGLKTEVEVKTL